MKFNKNIKKEIIVILLLFIIIFSIISLLSYDPNDTSFFSKSMYSSKIKNLFGIFGSIFANFFISYFGLGAFCIPFLLSIIMFDYFKNRISISILLTILIGGLLLIISTGSLFSLKQNHYLIFNNQFSSGGFIGISFKNLIIMYYNKIGGTIILILTLLLGFIISTNVSVFSLFKNLKSLFFLSIKFIFNINSKIKIDTTEQNLSLVNSNSRIKNKNSNYKKPTIEFLENSSSKFNSKNKENFENQSMLLNKTLQTFGIEGKVVAINPGPVVTTFEYKPALGVKINKIVNLADDIALALKSISIRIIAPIPGKAAIGIEIPNNNRKVVSFKEIITSKSFLNSNFKLTLCLGKDITGNPVSTGLEKMPHLLIAGATGTGKSVALNTIICSLLYKHKPNQVKLIMIDPKRIELSTYNGIPHLITPVITDMKKAINALNWTIKEMENRYNLLYKENVKNIHQYNNIHNNKLPYIVIIIDEFADLMMTASRNVEIALTRLAQMARASGIHLILATQRPSVDVITGTIKANFPTRLTFKVSSKIDSRTIIDSNGAENLLGDGDMLFIPPGTAKLQRIHGAYISEEELDNIIKFVKKQQEPCYDETIVNTKEKESTPKQKHDELYENALELIKKTKQTSISMIQRNLRIGYNRAARIVETMEKAGVISPQDGTKYRKVLIKTNDEHK